MMASDLFTNTNAQTIYLQNSPKSFFRNTKYISPGKVLLIGLEKDLLLIKSNDSDFKNPGMKRKTVSSTIMSSVGYEAGKRILEIQFSSGEVYQYFNVPKKVYEGLMNAPSHGQYFNNHIKDAGFDFEKIT